LQVYALQQSEQGVIMNRIDIIIDALERKEGFYNKYKLENALEAARELRELKPVAIRNPTNGIIEVQWGESVPLGTKLYALDEVTK